MVIYGATTATFYGSMADLPDSTPEWPQFGGSWAATPKLLGVRWF